MSTTRELGEFVEHHRPCRHVDADGQGLGRKDEFDQPVGETPLDDLAKRWNEPRVMDSNSTFDLIEEPRITEYGQVVLGKLLGPLLGDGENLGSSVEVVRRNPVRRISSAVSSH